jgi:hypothetical protein
MNKELDLKYELEIKEYLSSLTFQADQGSITAIHSLGYKVDPDRIEFDGVNGLEKETLIDLLKDEIIKQKFPDYWISLFLENKSTFKRF